jgi:hypothetical protein
MALLAIFSLETPILAADFSSDTGLSFGSGSGANHLQSPSPVIGAEYTVHVTPGLSFGGFYDHTFLSYVDGGTGAIHFMGAVLRAGLKDHGFIDLKVGLTKLISNEAMNAVATNVTLGAELGIGYEFKLSHALGLTPRVALRFLPDPSTQCSTLQPTPTGSVMLSFHF